MDTDTLDALIEADTIPPAPGPIHLAARTPAELEAAWAWQDWQTDCGDPRPAQDWSRLSAKHGD